MNYSVTTLFSYIQSFLSDCVRPWVMWWSSRTVIDNYWSFDYRWRNVCKAQNYSIQSMSSFLTEANPAYKTPTKVESKYFNHVSAHDARDRGIAFGRRIPFDLFRSLDYISHLTICNHDHSRLNPTTAIDFCFGDSIGGSVCVYTMHVTEETQFDENNCVLVPIHLSLHLLSVYYCFNVPNILVLDSSIHHEEVIDDIMFNPMLCHFYDSPAICVTAHGTNVRFSLRQIMDMSSCIFEHDHDEIYQKNGKDPPYTSFLLYSGSGYSAKWLPDTREQAGFVLK